MAEKIDDETLERTALNRLVHIANYGSDEPALCAVQVLLDHVRHKRVDATCGLGLSAACGLTSSASRALQCVVPAKAAPSAVEIALADIGWSAGDVVAAVFEGKFKKGGE